MASAGNAINPNNVQGSSSTGKTNSRTVTDTIVGEHTHTIVGYSLIKGIGDGEPVASERFTVGGHEWVLLFYPDGKKSSSSEGHIHAPPVAGDHAGNGLPAAPPAQGAAAGLVNVLGVPHPHPPAADAANDGHVAVAAGNVAGVQHPGNHHLVMPHLHPGVMQPLQQVRPQRRDTTNDYAALFVALIGEGPNPQGVVNTSEGKVVRAFHRFTLVNQSPGGGSHLTKGRTRDAGAVKISCARQDPNARNCHGYRKFVKRSILEDPTRGFLSNDTIVIKYTIELVVSSGGALSRSSVPPRSELIKVPPPMLGKQMAELLASSTGADVAMVVEGEEMRVHKIILEARSPVFKAMLNMPMREGSEGRVTIKDIRAPVFRALLHFVYTDTLPEELEGANLDAAMAQHLLVAADRYELERLRRICERRLCETVDVETAATTLTLAEQNRAEELKRVCLDFVARHLAAVMQTDGFKHMVESCPQLQEQLLQTIASQGGNAFERHHMHRTHTGHTRLREGEPAQDERRVRPRRAEVL